MSSFHPQPVYFTFLVPHDANEEEMGGGEEEEEEEDGTAAGQRGGEAEPDKGNEASQEKGSESAAAGNQSLLHSQTYTEAAKKYYLQHTDNNMVGGRRSTRVCRRRVTHPL